MIERGLRRGDRVAIWLYNSPEVVIALFAVLKAGAVFVILNPTTKWKKVEYILNNSRARALITDASNARALGAQWSSMPHLEMFFIAGDMGTIDLEGTSEVQSRLSAHFHDPTSPSSPPQKCAIDIDLAALLYTSGSTGRPKGVMMTHLNMVSAADSITTYLESAFDDIVLNFYRCRSTYGLYQVLMATSKLGNRPIGTVLYLLHGILEIRGARTHRRGYRSSRPVPRCFRRDSRTEQLLSCLPSAI